jgi:hypothetical protein
MVVKDELFSFQGFLLTLLHDTFVMGVLGVVVLGAWVWTGQNPIRERVTFASEEDALLYLMDRRPDMNIEMSPKKARGK